ncbi:MAG: N-methyl-L-tryptophan oxidase [Gemmatimonadetes bacterium]|nr:N-methyl-L-tryptophan oxidase [Gemmatimonadota bacterium]
MIRHMKKGGATFDVVVAGLGAMGSAAVYHLAKSGMRVAGFDRFHPPHARGSSHGHARVIREAYAAGPAYVDLIRRAYALWEALEDESDEELFRTYGHLSMRPPGGAERLGVLESALAFDIPVERVSTEDVRRRYPMFRVDDGWEGIFEPRAGAVFPEACIDAHLRLAQSAGAELSFDCPVLDWTADGSAVRVKAQSGEISAGRLVVCAGAWVSRLAADLALPVEIERMTLFFFRPLRNPGMFTSGRCPNNTWVNEDGVSFYCQPDFGRGFKAALHCGRAGVNPDTLERNTSPDDEARIRPLVERFIPDAAGPVVESHVCMYTNLPDTRWIVDYHPGQKRVIIASPCSGHGFKFSSAIGEIVARMCMGETEAADPGMFGIAPLLAGGSRT